MDVVKFSSTEGVPSFYSTSRVWKFLFGCSEYLNQAMYLATQAGWPKFNPQNSHKYTRREQTAKGFQSLHENLGMCAQACHMCLHIINSNFLIAYFSHFSTVTNFFTNSNITSNLIFIIICTSLIAKETHHLLICLICGGRRDSTAFRVLASLPKTPVQFPPPTIGGSQSSITPALEDLTPSSGLYQHLHTCTIHSQTHAHK